MGFNWLRSYVAILRSGGIESILIEFIHLTQFEGTGALLTYRTFLAVQKSLDITHLYKSTLLGTLTRITRSASNPLG